MNIILTQPRLINLYCATILSALNCAKDKKANNKFVIQEYPPHLHSRQPSFSLCGSR